MILITETGNLIPQLVRLDNKNGFCDCKFVSVFFCSALGVVPREDKKATTLTWESHMPQNILLSAHNRVFKIEACIMDSVARVAYHHDEHEPTKLPCSLLLDAFSQLLCHSPLWSVERCITQWSRALLVTGRFYRTRILLLSYRATTLKRHADWWLIHMLDEFLAPLWPKVSGAYHILIEPSSVVRRLSSVVCP